MVRSRKFRHLEAVYKHAVKVSKPRITPILEGKCRMQGPQDESVSEHELDTVCGVDRTLEVIVVEPMDACTSTDASKKCSNNKQSSNTGIQHNTDDKQMIGKKIPGKQLACKHTAGKSASKNFVEREEMSGRMKTSISSSAHRRKGNKTRGTDIRTLPDYGLKVEMQTTSIIQQSEKPLVIPIASQSNNEEKIASCGRQSEETHNKCFVEEPATVIPSNETLNNADTKVCHDDKDIKEQEEVDMELPQTKPNYASKIDSESVATSLDRSNLDTCNAEPVLVLSDAKESKESLGLTVPMLLHSLKGSELDNHISGCKNSAGVSEIYGIAEAYNDEDLKEGPIVKCSSKLENIAEQAATHTESLLAANVHSLSVHGTEIVDLTVESGPFDHSISSSPKKRESSNILISEENISQEAVCSFPLSVTPGHSSVTSANQSVTTAKEIEAHSSCQHEEDFSLTSATICMESSSTKNLILEDAKDVSPILLVSLSGSQEYQKNDSLKRNELDDDSHIGEEATNKIGLSDLVSSLGVSLPSEDTEKSCKPFSGEEDVKVCDICGDSGIEELLAICRLCKDGAEHIYCMQPMLDEVPEGDWLCEGCKLKQNVNATQTETHPSLAIISKSPSLTGRKDNFYSTARSRLSAKLEKKKFVPERKRALKGFPSSLVSTKRQAEDSDPGTPTKRMAVGTPNSNIGFLSSNVKAVISRENSFKAIDKVKTMLDVASTGNLSSNSNHDSGKSSTLYGSSSPKLTVNSQLLKNNFFSFNSRTADSSAFTGASKAGNNAPSGGLATHTVKNPTDMTSFPSPIQKVNSFKKSSAIAKFIKDSHEESLHDKADMEHVINSHALGTSTKILKRNTKADSPTISDPGSTSHVDNPVQKELSGKVTKDGSGLPKNLMTKSLSISRDIIPVRTEKMEKISVDRDAKPVSLPIKDSSKSRTVWSEGKMVVSPTPVIPNSNHELCSSRFSVGWTQSKTSPSKLKGVVAKKIQNSASTEAPHKFAPEKSKELFLLETTKSMANIFSSCMEDDKRSMSSGDNLVPKVISSHHDKRSENLENKAVPNDYCQDENKKMGNVRKFSSLEWSSSNHLGAVGSTRCYKCKELGHSAQSCTNRSRAETGTTSLRVSNLIASAGRTSGDTQHIVGVKSSSVDETAPSSNYKASVSDQNSGRRQVQFESEKDHAQQPDSDLHRQVPNNKETSYVDRASNSMKILKETPELNKHPDNKISNCQHSTFMDVGGGSSSMAQILTSGPSNSSVVDPTSTSPMIEEEKTLPIGCNEKKKSEVADSPKCSFQKGLSEDESSLEPGDSSQITAVINQHYPAEVSVVATRGNSLHGVDTSLERSNHQSMKLTSVQSRSSSQLETTKATSLPQRDFLWQGGFQVQSKEVVTSNFDGIQAHASTSAAPKVLDAAKKFSSIILLEEAPLHSTWPTQFRRYRPSDDNIALYFFAKDNDSYDRPYQKLLERMLKNDVALRGNLDAVELLVFPSNQLAEKSQYWNGLLFLWGVFREMKSSCSELSTCKGESIPRGFAKRDMLGSINLNVHDSQQAHDASSQHRLSALGDMNIQSSGNEDSKALNRTLRDTGNHWLPSVLSQGEGFNGNSHASNITNLSFHEDKEFQKIEKKAGEQVLAKKHSIVSLFESDEQAHSKGSHCDRSNRLDFAPAFENSTAHKLNATNGITSEKLISQQMGLVGSTQPGGASCSYVSLQTEKMNLENSSALPFSSAICLSPIERNAHSCDTSRNDNFHSDTPCGQANIIKGKKRHKDFENETLMERTKDMEMGSAHGIKHPCISRSLSSPQLVVQSLSPTRQIYKYDCQHSRTHSPDLDHTKRIQVSPGWQVPETVPDFVGSSYERSTDIAVDGKDAQRKFNNAEVQGKNIGKEQDASGTRFAKTKKLPVQSYHIADLNQVADFDTAVEFSDPPIQQHIQPQNLDGYSLFPQDCRVMERVFFPCFEFSSSHMSSKPSEQWQIQLSSKQESSELSSTIQLISTEEDKGQLDLNKPNLELALGGKMTSSNPVALPAFVNLLNQTSGQLPKSPIRSSSVQGIENGSSLALSLAFPSQNDQTAKSMKEEYTKPVNCVNTSFSLFGHRVNG